MCQSPTATMDSLPFEVQQQICSHLAPADILEPPKDLQMVRLSCKRLAAAALPYMLPRLFLYNTPDSRQHLSEVIGHQVLNKHVTTIIYDAWKLPKFRNLRRWLQHFLSQRGLDLENFSMQEIKGYRTKYNNMINQQAHNGWDHSMMDSFKCALAVCPKLQNIVLTRYHHDSIEEVRRLRAFKGFLPMSFQGSIGVEPSSTRLDVALADVLYAVEQAGNSLNSLTIINVCLRDYSVANNTHIIGNMRHLRLKLDAFDWATHSDLQDSERDLEAFVTAAKRLETIWLSLPRSHGGFSIDGILRGIEFKYLRDCMFEAFNVSEEVLVRFLLQHSQSLQQLDMRCASMLEGTWQSVFTRVSRQLPALKRVQFLELQQARTGTADFEEYTDEYHEEAAQYVLNGGDAPHPTPYVWALEVSNNWSSPFRRTTASEDGLWRDFDGVIGYYL